MQSSKTEFIKGGIINSNASSRLNKICLPSKRLKSNVTSSSCSITDKNMNMNIKTSIIKTIGNGITAASILAISSIISGSPALASEFDILTTSTPTSKYVLDDANVLSITTEGTLNDRLKKLENDTGYRLEVVTLRKLDNQPDPFEFGDSVIERWYPTIEEGDKKGLMLVVTTGREGAISGGPSFLKAMGDDLIESLVSDDIPILTEQEKFNETTLETTNRIASVLSGKEDPGGPIRKVNERKRTYKTKEETDKTRNVTSTIVATLLFIAVVVPMLQYYGYTAEE